MFRSLRVLLNQVQAFRKAVVGYFNRKRVVGPVLRWIAVYNLGLEVVFQVVPVLDRQHSILSVLSKEVVEHLEAFLQLEVGSTSRTRFCHN